MVEAIREKISEGYGKKEISEMYDVSVMKITHEVKKAGYVNFRELQYEMRYGAEPIVDILDMIREGKSHTHVLKKMKMSEVKLRDELNIEGYATFREARKDLFLWRDDLELLDKIQEIVTDELSIKKATDALKIKEGRIKEMLRRERRTWDATKEELMKKNKKVL